MSELPDMVDMLDRLVPLIRSARADGWQFKMAQVSDLTGNDRIELTLWREPDQSASTGSDPAQVEGEGSREHVKSPPVSGGGGET